METHRSNFQSFTKSKETETDQKYFFTVAEFSKIEWIEDNEEFERNGKLYDVSQIEKTENGFIVYCENDRWEEEFVSLFSSWKDQKRPDGKLKFFFQPINIVEKISIRIEIALINSHSLEHNFQTQIFFIRPPSPPPDFFVLIF